MTLRPVAVSEDKLEILRPLTVTVEMAKNLSGLGYTTIWGLIKSEKLEVVRVRRRTLITYRSLENLLQPSHPLRETDTATSAQSHKDPKLKTR